MDRFAAAAGPGSDEHAILDTFLDAVIRAAQAVGDAPHQRISRLIGALPGRISKPKPFSFVSSQLSQGSKREVQPWRTL